MGSGFGGQPIVRGIQAVGSVKVYYKYNGGKLVLNSQAMRLGAQSSTTIDFSSSGTGVDTNFGVQCTGFRLDGNFLDANQQVPSSSQIPLLGGGAVALTNNNRSGTLTINTTRVGSYSATGENGTEKTFTYDPDPSVSGDEETITYTSGASAVGALERTSGLGPVDSSIPYYDLILLLQAQQGVAGGDAWGSTITIVFAFNGSYTIVQFQGCTVASIKPLTLSGNDAADYAASINYLNWTVRYSSSTETAVSDS